ncbi:Pol polyprotein [Elysia marginata]|uniref:Pol polyprotein n=1 Tax=Elysia marginata TaxID=1093978 RepID=A0AAV4HPU8_9GAST|nr:Pol polyprotein [Elysia marginata]
MGDIADDILAVMQLDESRTTYQETLVALDAYFNSKKNTIFARARFNRKVQQPRELVDSFIQDLHKLADECSYLTLKDELIRDRIVVGVRDDDLSKVLQGKQDLDLSEAIRLSRQAEARKEGQNLLRPRVDLVKSFARTSHNSGNKRFVPAKQLSPNTTGTKCGNCGKSPRHKKEACPARTATCHSCNKKGHYSSICRSSKVREAQVADKACHFLGSVHHVGEIDATWTAVLHVDGNPVKFKLDTGAAVSVVGERFANGRSLQSCDKLLKRPGDTPLQVLGVFQAKLSYKDSEMWETLHVIQGQHQPLLSASACLQLGLIARLNSLTTETPDFRTEFPNLFKGLGRLKESYTIKTRPDIQPVSIYTPQKIAHPLITKVKTEIDRLLSEGVISPVNEPTDWCSGIVVVTKPNQSSVRICVDLKQSCLTGGPPIKFSR